MKDDWGLTRYAFGIGVHLKFSLTAKRQEKSYSNELLLKWWAHQDLNLGPKDYEQVQEIKPITNQ
jgi:hypothetical protein